MKEKKEKITVNKTILYGFDSEEEYHYNTHHGTIYPYNGFPTGIGGKKYKKTRFIRWNPKPEDIFIRHVGSQIHVDFKSIFPDIINDQNKNIGIFQLRAKRLELQNLICEQINFFSALYDEDNDLITSMFAAKFITDSQTYTVETFEEYYKEIFDTLFPPRTIEKIKLMVEENDVGDDIVGLFPLDFLRDVFIVSFMFKIMHIYVEHFILSTGNQPKNLWCLFADAFTHIINQINPNMYILLFNYVQGNVQQTIKANANIYDMQAIDGVTAPTTIHVAMRKTMLCDGLIKLTFASDWDAVNKRPSYSCVGLIKSVISRANELARRIQLRFALVTVDDVSQLTPESISSSSPISSIRSFNPGQYQCTAEDLQIILAHIALEVDLDPLDFYLEHLICMNDLSKILIATVLYNKFHSSISINTLSNNQKYILLMYVRHLVMEIYGLTEAETTGNPVINILMGKTVSQANRTLTQKDINGIKKYVKLNNLKEYLLSGEKNASHFIENIIHCVLSSYTIVNHNDTSLLDTPLIYESGQMTLQLLDMVVEIFERM